MSEPPCHSSRSVNTESDGLLKLSFLIHEMSGEIYVQ